MNAARTAQNNAPFVRLFIISPAGTDFGGTIVLELRRYNCNIVLLFGRRAENGTSMATWPSGILADMTLEIRIYEGDIANEPAPIKVQLERKGRLVVAIPTGTVAPLTSATVEK